MMALIAGPCSSYASIRARYISTSCSDRTTLASIAIWSSVIDFSVTSNGSGGNTSEHAAPPKRKSHAVKRGQNGGVTRDARVVIVWFLDLQFWAAMLARKAINLRSNRVPLPTQTERQLLLRIAAPSKQATFG